MSKKVILGICFVSILLSSGIAAGQFSGKPESDAKILGLMEQILDKIQPALQSIDPELRRIAFYRLLVNGEFISPPLRDHFENRLIEVLRNMERPAVVSLPEFNTLKITSTDSSFSIINTQPSPEELWRVGRQMRVDAYLEGKLAYLPGNALILDLRLNRTGTNEVLWAQSFTANEKPLEDYPKNPFKYSFNMGTEVFPVQFESAADSLLRTDFNHRLTHYSIYFGVYQYLWGNRHFRYEVRFGASFLTDGIKMRNTYFEDPAFYGNSSDAVFSIPISYNVRTLIYSTLIENAGNETGDWLSLYLSLTRYFAVKMPDLNSLGVGLRADISSHFSLSAGFSLVFGDKFKSVPIKETGQSVNLRIKGIQYEIFFLQYTF